MSKKDSKFNNRAARKFNDVAKVDTMSQAEIFEILDEDIKTILGQFTDHREHKPGATYPNYVANAFANISTALFFNRYVKDHVKVKKHGKIKSDLTKDELESLRQILAEAYKKSQTNFYAVQAQEYPERNKLLTKTFIRLYPKVYALTKRLKGLDKSQRRDLTIQIYGDPVYNMKFVHKIFNQSVLKEKKKLELMKKMYGKRFVKAVGAAMTVEGNSSDCLAMLYDYMASRKKKKRAPYILAYAEAYKKNKSRYFRIDADFYEANKPIIKDLIDLDLGFKKAVKNLKGTKSKDKEPKHNSGKPDTFRPTFKR